MLRKATPNLIPVKRTVHRGGEVHTQTYYVRPEGETLPEHKRLDKNGPPQPNYRAMEHQGYGRGAEVRAKLAEVAQRFEQEQAQVQAELKAIERQQWAHQIAREYSDEAGQQESQQTLQALERQQLSTLGRLEGTREAYAKAILETLDHGEARPQGRMFFDPGSEGQTLPEYTQAYAQSAMEFIQTVLSPRVIDFFSVQVSPTDTFPHFMKPENRVYIREGDPPETAVHEIAHALEHWKPSAFKPRLMAFWQERTQGQEMQVYKGKMAFVRDHFAHWYMGRLYPRPRGGEDEGGLELFSMGLELLYSDPVGLARNDPEFFDLMLDLLQGGEQ